MSGKNFKRMRRLGTPTVNASAAEVEALLADAPPDIARQIEESLDDLRHDRIEDTGAFLQRMRAKIADARAAIQGDKRQSQ